MTSAERIADIRQRAEREYYSCREHFAMFDADEDVLFLLERLDAAERRLKEQQEAASYCAVEARRSGESLKAAERRLHALQEEHDKLKELFSRVDHP